MQQPATIGIDLAKNVFRIHGVDADGAVVLKRKLRRNQAPTLLRRSGAQPRRDGGLRRSALRGS